MGGCHSSAGSALSCGLEFAGSNLQFAFVISVSEQTLLQQVREGVSFADAPLHLSSVHFVLLEKREKSTE